LRDKLALSASQREAVKVVLLAGLITLLLCIVFKDRWPNRAAFHPAVFQEPAQTSGQIPAPFDVVQKGYTYTIYPVFEYELWGLVVSSHYAGSFIDLAHETWKDYLNIKDLCIIWGKNLETDAFRRIKFWNRDFTCFYSWADRTVGASFSASFISNNHLITPNPLLRRIIKGVRRGDQVHFRGWLAKYGHKGSAAVRGTSTTRNDTGNGACETVYVTEFEVIRRANPGWRTAFPVSLGAIGICGLLLLLL
jgi:hypothetical protein